MAKNRIYQRLHVKHKGFTLIELLVVIAIILSLSAIVFGVVRRAMLNAQKVQTANTIRALQTGLIAFQTEYNRPPLPDSVIAEGQDVVIGERGTPYSNAYIVAVLEGLGPQDVNKNFSFGGEEWKVELVNKKLEAYTAFPRVNKKKNGVYDKIGDSSHLELFDAWGYPLMIALNVPPFQTDFQQGSFDKRCYTNELADYTDTRPFEENFAIWSYGKDGVKGSVSGGKQIPRFAGSDDVKSW